MAYLQTRILPHNKKVCSLYKRAVRALEAWTTDRAEFRYNAVLMRARFEENRNVKDLRKAKLLLQEGEEELWRDNHYQPIYFPFSPKGVAYERHPLRPDWVLDNWHPLEKAQYPHYFARREKRKDEFIEMWEKEYGKPDKSAGHH